MKISPIRTYSRKTAALGLIEFDGATPFTVAAKAILEKHEVAFLKPLLLGSGTGTLVVAGPVEEVRGATDRDWLMQPEVVGKFHKKKPLIATHCFDNPSQALWQVMQDIEPIEAPPIDLTGDQLTLGVFEDLRIVPFLESLEHIGRWSGLTYIGFMNFGSQHKSLFFCGDQHVVEDAKWATKDFIRELMAQDAIEGEYDGSWFLNLDQTHHDLIFLLPWQSNPRPYADTLGQDSYLAIETAGLVDFFKGVNQAAWRADVTAIAPRELGSGTETAILTSPEEDHINDAFAAIEGLPRLLNVRRWHKPKKIFGAHMTEPKVVNPAFDMTGLSNGLVDTRDRGGLYDAVHDLRLHDVRFIGSRKIGSRRAFMTFSGEQAEVEAAIADIEARAERELTKPERCGELFATDVLKNPHEQALKLLPWQVQAPYLSAAPEGQELSDPYYEPGDPFAFVEGLGMTHGLVIANMLFHEGVTPVSVYGVGSGLKNFHFTAKDYDLLRELLDWDYLVSNICAHLPHTYDAEDGLGRMLVNVNTYAEPGPIWQLIDHQVPVEKGVIDRLRQNDVAVGLFTTRGMNLTLYLLDQLKNYGVDLWGIQKSGGLHMTTAIYGPLGQVHAAVNELPDKLRRLDYDLTRTWALISNPHPNLAFLLPRDLRVGV